jgi:hypothetical protein
VGASVSRESHERSENLHQVLVGHRVIHNDLAVGELVARHSAGRSRAPVRKSDHLIAQNAGSAAVMAPSNFHWNVGREIKGPF